MSDKDKRVVYPVIGVLIVIIAIFIIAKVFNKDNEVAPDGPMGDIQIEDNEDEGKKLTDRDKEYYNEMDKILAQREKEASKKQPTKEDLNKVSHQDLADMNINIYSDDIDKLVFEKEGYETSDVYIMDKDNHNKYIKIKMSHKKGDVVDLMSRYDVLIQGENSGNIIKPYEKDLIIDFRSMLFNNYYVNNPSFAEFESRAKKDNSRDVAVTREGIGKILKGYYKTVKENFPEIRYVYFGQVQGIYSKTKNAKDYGVWFLEEGQKKPTKAPGYFQYLGRRPHVADDWFDPYQEPIDDVDDNSRPNTNNDVPLGIPSAPEGDNFDDDALYDDSWIYNEDKEIPDYVKDELIQDALKQQGFDNIDEEEKENTEKKKTDKDSDKEITKEGNVKEKVKD